MWRAVILSYGANQSAEVGLFDNVVETNLSKGGRRTKRVIAIVIHLRGFLIDKVIGATVVDNQLDADVAIHNRFAPTGGVHNALAVLEQDGADDNIGVDLTGKRSHGVG